MTLGDGQRSHTLTLCNIDVERIDNDTAMVIFGTNTKEDIEPWLEDRAAEDPAEHEGFTFISWSDWVSEIKNIKARRLRTLPGEFDLCWSVEEPARKRAKTSA